MNLERIKLFLAVVDSGSLTAAARVAHLTQPAISRSLKLLEEEIQAPLFERRGRGVALTAAGRALVPRARELLACAADVPHEVGRVAKRDYHDLRLGTVESVATFLVPNFVPAVQREFPKLVLRLEAARTAKLL